MKSNPKKARFSWALYDFANTIFSMNIISLYFVLWITVDKNCTELFYSLAFSGSVLLAAIIMPALGEVSDRLKVRMPFLIGFTLSCVFFTALLGLVNLVSLALIFFFLANFCYQLAGVIYNSLLVQVSTPQTLGRTSGLGVSLGYLGAIVGLLLVIPFMVAGGKQATFVPTALLFLLFSLPAFIFIKDLPHPRIPRIELTLKNTFLRLIKDLAKIRKNRSLCNFFITAFLCLNAVNTIIVFVGVYAKRVMCFDDTEIIYFTSVSTIFAIIGSYIFGYLTDRWGSKTTLNTVIKFSCLTIFLAGISTWRWMFWIVGPLAGIFLGGTWVSARTMLIELSPREKAGQMFGLFGLAGSFSSILGPVVWGIIISLFAALGNTSYRLAMGSVFLFMLGGYFSFQAVPNLRRYP